MSNEGGRVSPDLLADIKPDYAFLKKIYRNVFIAIGRFSMRVGVTVGITTLPFSSIFFIRFFVHYTYLKRCSTVICFFTFRAYILLYKP
jgi:hypothetical protein